MDEKILSRCKKLSTVVTRITTYELNLKPNEYYCKNCQKIYLDNGADLPNFCGGCGGSWRDSFEFGKDPVIIKEEKELKIDVDASKLSEGSIDTYIDGDSLKIQYSPISC